MRAHNTLLVILAALGLLLIVQGALYEEDVPPSIQRSPEGELSQQADDITPEGHADLMGGKPCMQRQEEKTQLLEAYQAARLVHVDSPAYGVEDDTTSQLVHAWEQQYKAAQAEYDFYCTQTKEDLSEIAAAVENKEAIAVQNAAQAGLIAAQATIKQKRQAAEKAHKDAQERKAKETEIEAQRRKSAQEKTDKLADEAIQKNTERLKRLPQITRHLYGMVRDGSTGQPVGDADIHSDCLFTARSAKSRANGKFTLANGISGPAGRQCKVSVSKNGYVVAKYPVTVSKGDTDAVFRQSMILPETSDDKKFRFVLQYGATPPNLDAHVLVPMPDAHYVDIGQAPLIPETDTLKFGANGTAKELPYTTLDHVANRFGPELASVHNVNDGVYHFVVSNAAQSFTTPRDFHRSVARAFLYQGNNLLSTVAINSAQGEPTHTWSVYTLSCLRGTCSLKIANKFVEQSPIH